ncbi:MAG: metal ABC transporter substrate-binding protein [Treponemataceae bacterium]|nr:metal ABC transporter substrate-binding protein [Treponemataceae bacterium]
MIQSEFSKSNMGAIIKLKKHYLFALFMIFCFLFSFSSCTKANSKQTEKINIVCTTFPQYDWTNNIIKGFEDNFSVFLLMDKGSDLHNYQPTAQDMIKIASSDLFIHVGGESDIWIKDFLSESTDKNRTVLNLVNMLGDRAKITETVEGMQETHHHDDDEDCDECEHEHHHDEAHELNHNDEHVWLSLKNAEFFVNQIANAIAETDTKNAQAYKENAAKYSAELAAIDEQFSEMVDNSKRKTVLFGDRFPFRYLVDDYGLDYFAAFSGCSAESEASFETIAFLSGKVSELKLPVVFAIEDSDKKIAQSIISNAKDTDAKILVLDSMQSVTSKDIAAGASYLGTMKNNLEMLKIALN